MQKVGLICDMNFSRHPQFKSYFYAYDMGVAGMKKLKIFLEKLGYKVERLDKGNFIAKI